MNLLCPVENCNFEFDGRHYTDREPHLADSHNNEQLARAIQQLLCWKEWADTMANDIINCCETLKYE